jgi:hypothetical protein
VSAAAPAMLFSEIEVQKRASSSSRLPTLPNPQNPAPPPVSPSPETPLAPPAAPPEKEPDPS